MPTNVSSPGASEATAKLIANNSSTQEDNAIAADDIAQETVEDNVIDQEIKMRVVPEFCTQTRADNLPCTYLAVYCCVTCDNARCVAHFSDAVYMEESGRACTMTKFFAVPFLTMPGWGGEQFSYVLIVLHDIRKMWCTRADLTKSIEISMADITSCLSAYDGSHIKLDLGRGKDLKLITSDNWYWFYIIKRAIYGDPEDKKIEVEEEEKKKIKRQAKTSKKAMMKSKKMKTE